MSIAYNGTVIQVPGSPDVTLQALGNGNYVAANAVPGTAYLQVSLSSLTSQSPNPKTKSTGSSTFSITARLPYLDQGVLIPHSVSLQIRSGYPNGRLHVETVDYLCSSLASLVTPSFLNGVLLGKR